MGLLGCVDIQMTLWPDTHSEMPSDCAIKQILKLVEDVGVLIKVGTTGRVGVRKNRLFQFATVIWERVAPHS